jgi:hypothetical protein
MKCANCNNEATFEYQMTKATSVFYCGKDLPKFLEERKRAGLLKITTAYKDAKASALDILSFSATAEASIEPIPVKKTTKKSEK